jgi:predicted ATP-dependent endonuclease of OLD family
MISRIVLKNFRRFRDFTMAPTDGINLLVGDNEVGKSTILEGISAALTGRLEGQWFRDALSPETFNAEATEDFFTNPSLGTLPEILIELYFSGAEANPDYKGKENSLRENVCGIRVRVTPDIDEYEEELKTYIDAVASDNKAPRLIPSEYYKVHWKTFEGSPVYRRPKDLGVSFVGERNVSASGPIDHFMRTMLNEFLNPHEKSSLSIKSREARHSITSEILRKANKSVSDVSHELYNRQIEIHMDNSPRFSWDKLLTPYVEGTPFKYVGEGAQTMIRIALNLTNERDATHFVLIEEPENHLAQGNLWKLLSKIEQLAGDRQVFVSTHSSYVFNRLGVDRLALIGATDAKRVTDLDQTTVRFFKKLSGFDTLRLVIGTRVVLLEGPSDDMAFNATYKKIYGREPRTDGIDVIAMNGISFKRALELCKLVDKRVAVITDNDHRTVEQLKRHYTGYLSDRVALFTGDDPEINTLEPQMTTCNNLSLFNEVLQPQQSFASLEEAAKYMQKHKTEGMLKIVEDCYRFSFPSYLNEAARFIHDGLTDEQ